MILALTTLTGCAITTRNSHLNSSKVPTLQEAKADLDEGELYEARRKTERILQAQPANSEAQILMAQIIDREIARHKETFETKVPEEFTPDQNAEQAKTWLERSRMLLQAEQYEQAMRAAEKVFIYDPDSWQASELLDEIRNEAFAAGKEQSLIVSQVTHTEIQDRVTKYHQQAEEAMRKGRLGEARLTLDKLLLLSPEDDKALKLREEIRAKQRVKTA